MTRQLHRCAGTVGRKPRNDERLELERLRRENQRLAEQLRKAETIIEVQKNISEILGLTPANQEASHEEKD